MSFMAISSCRSSTLTTTSAAVANSGVLALAEVEKRLRVAERLARCIDDPRCPDQVVHSLADVIGFRMKMIAAGYEDGNDANRALRSGLQDGPGCAAVGSGSGLAIDDVPAGEPARRARAGRHGAGDG
ncbi:transposase [Mesorhizobium sp. M0244]|uniref:transposase n=1 Tax=Mesorhizobium sp. M0244 TaxID=2956926 RepID=UPI00333DA548